MFICPSFLGIYSFAGTNLLNFHLGGSWTKIHFLVIHLFMFQSEELGMAGFFGHDPYMISSVSKPATGPDPERKEVGGSPADMLQCWAKTVGDMQATFAVHARSATPNGASTKSFKSLQCHHPKREQHFSSRTKGEHRNSGGHSRPGKDFGYVSTTLSSARCSPG